MSKTEAPRANAAQWEFERAIAHVQKGMRAITAGAGLAAAEVHLARAHECLQRLASAGQPAPQVAEFAHRIAALRAAAAASVALQNSQEVAR